MFFKQLVNSFLNLIYPKSCGGCGGYLVEGEDELCTQCACKLSITGYSRERDNKAEQLLWGKAKVKAVSSYCYFHKEGISQHLLHNLKYRNRRKLGVVMGKLIGNDIKGTPLSEVDYIIPVPLHKERLKKRGYNQAEALAEGISSVICVPIETTTLIRTRSNESQTHKNRIERYENSIGLFGITDTTKLKGKRVLIVDDVITTGATMEACANALRKIEGIEISCVSFAIA